MDSLLTKKQNQLLPVEVRKECEMIIAKGAKLLAVKLIKDSTHLGLRECKHIADCIHEEMIVSKARATALDYVINGKDNRKIN